MLVCYCTFTTGMLHPWLASPRSTVTPRANRLTRAKFWGNREKAITENITCHALTTRTAGLASLYEWLLTEQMINWIARGGNGTKRHNRQTRDSHSHAFTVASSHARTARTACHRLTVTHARQNHPLHSWSEPPDRPTARDGLPAQATPPAPGPMMAIAALRRRGRAGRRSRMAGRSIWGEGVGWLLSCRARPKVPPAVLLPRLYKHHPLSPLERTRTHHLT